MDDKPNTIQCEKCIPKMGLWEMFTSGDNPSTFQGSGCHSETYKSTLDGFPKFYGQLECTRDVAPKINQMSLMA